MAITPQTNIRLLKVPITISNKNQILFSSEEAQYNYFNSLEMLEPDIDDSSYQRKDSVIRYPGHIDEIINYNYVMYQNENYGSKWFYAFITNMEYENDGLTLITIKTDVFQTWQFDLEYKESFVEREHVSDDTIGKNLIDEGLNTGSIVCVQSNVSGYSGSDKSLIEENVNVNIVVGTTYGFEDIADQDGENVSGGFYNNLYSAVKYYVFEYNTNGITQLKDFLTKLDKKGKAEAVNCIFLAPNSLAYYNGENNNLVQTNSLDTLYINNDNLEPDSSINKIININNTLDGYTPKNNKLLTYPYRYLLVSNNNGADVIYYYEFFETKPKFKIEGVLSPRLLCTYGTS